MLPDNISNLCVRVRGWGGAFVVKDVTGGCLRGRGVCVVVLTSCVIGVAAAGGSDPQVASEDQNPRCVCVCVCVFWVAVGF